MIKIVFIENDQKEHSIIKMVFPENFIISATNGAAGIEYIKKEDPDIVILSLDLPDYSGKDLLYRIISLPYSPPVIILSAHSDTQIIVDMIKAGAADYIIKPYNSNYLKKSINKALADSLRPECSAIPNAHPELDKLIGESHKIQRIKHLIHKYASTDESILLCGESGTGKDLAAKIIHSMSGRKTGPYSVKNCGAIPLSLIETEMFGSEKGAFTDAVSRPGSFESSYGGTLFLDEIGEMELSAQVKLLRILEDKTLVRVGGTKKIPIDVRIIAATNKNLKAAISSGCFRPDLFYRLNLLTIELPSLREIKEDIPLLAQSFLKDSNKIIKRGAFKKLIDHQWPGNVRELKYVLRRAELLSEETPICQENISF